MLPISLVLLKWPEPLLQLIPSLFIAKSKAVIDTASTALLSAAAKAFVPQSTF